MKMHKISIRFNGSDGYADICVPDDSSKYNSSLFDVLWMVDKSDSVIEFRIDDGTVKESIGWNFDKLVTNFNW